MIKNALFSFFLFPVFVALSCIPSDGYSQEYDAETYDRVMGIVEMLFELDEEKDRIELTERQRELLKKTHEAIRLLSIARSDIDYSKTTERDKVTAKMTEIGKNFESALLPHQRKIITQAHYSFQVRNLRSFGFHDSYVAKRIGLSKEQKAKIEKFALELQDEMNAELDAVQKKINQITEKHLDKHLKLLTVGQRKTYKDKFWPRQKMDQGINPRKFMDR